MKDRIDDIRRDAESKVADLRNKAEHELKDAKYGIRMFIQDYGQLVAIGVAIFAVGALVATFTG